MFQRFLGPYVESNPALEMGFVKIGLATEGRRGEDGSVNESRAGEVSQATESRADEVGPITEFRAAEIGGTTEGRANEFGPLTERRSIETDPFTDDSAGEVRIVREGSPEKIGETTEGRANEFGPLTERRTGPFTDDSAGEVRIVPEGPEKEGTARREDNDASSPFFFRCDAPPFTIRKIRAVAELESFEIDLILQRLGKVDARECHMNVLAGRIAPPGVPGVLAFCREVKKEGLIIFPVGGWLTSPRLGLALVRRA
jgi:hypothetical protein